MQSLILAQETGFVSAKKVKRRRWGGPLIKGEKLLHFLLHCWRMNLGGVSWKWTANPVPWSRSQQGFQTPAEEDQQAEAVVSVASTI